MGEPNYVLYANDAEWVPKENQKALSIVKKIIWGYIGVIVAFSLLVGENMFVQMSLYAKCMLSIAVMWTIFTRGEERKPVPFEIQFFDDYLVYFCLKKRYSKKKNRMEYYKFYYKDITSCVYRERSKRIDMYGLEEVIWYDYNKDGTVPEKPTYHRSVDAICYFYTMFNEDIDFVSEIEQHSLIKVIIDKE